MSRDEDIRPISSDRRTFRPPDAQPPDAEILARLADAGFSRRGLDSVGGLGTAARLRRGHARQVRKAKRQRRLAAIVDALRGLGRQILKLAVGALGLLVGIAAVVVALRLLIRRIARHLRRRWSK
jgi:hypothetical protein